MPAWYAKGMTTNDGLGGGDPEMFGEAWMAQAESGTAGTGAWVESADEAYATAQAEGLAAADLDEEA